MVYMMLENPASIKDKTTKDLLFKILADLVKHFKHTLSLLCGFVWVRLCGNHRHQARLRQLYTCSPTTSIWLARLRNFLSCCRQHSSRSKFLPASSQKLAAPTPRCFVLHLQLHMANLLYCVSFSIWQELARDASGAKFVAMFLAEVGERLPRCMLLQLSVLFPLLDGEVCVT
jgi:hypothetical protein